ncbi:MAG: NAD(P)/FAD-dependent oxidoreductase [Holosporales bacterium]|nr:NAD(P)/FAD-dependent oxidoreductase [Holosporales bacterium]
MNLSTVAQSDVVIIGAGVAGLYATYCCGIAGLSCTLIDSLPCPGGQCTALYPEKNVYGVPGFRDVKASDFIDSLADQCLAFDHTELFGYKVESVSKIEDGTFTVHASGRADHASVSARYVIIAAGICDMEPSIPQTIQGLDEIDQASDFVQSCCIKIDMYKGKDVMVAGGGDSAADFALSVAPIAKSVTLVHRRDKLTCNDDKKGRLAVAKEAGKLRLMLASNIVKLTESNDVRSVFVKDVLGTEINLSVDHVVFCYGFVAKCNTLSWLSDLDLDIRDGLIAVDVGTMESSVKNCYVVGDIVTYTNKIKNIVQCFSEADRAVRMIRSKV